MSSERTAILTFSIGPVHSFIGQARRIADLWAGSEILSEVTGAAMETLRTTQGATPIFPAIGNGTIPPGLPNRFVARVPEAEAAAIAQKMAERVQKTWAAIVERAVATLKKVEIDANRECASSH